MTLSALALASSSFMAISKSGTIEHWLQNLDVAGFGK